MRPSIWASQIEPDKESCKYLSPCLYASQPAAHPKFPWESAPAAGSEQDTPLKSSHIFDEQFRPLKRGKELRPVCRRRRKVLQI